MPDEQRAAIAASVRRAWKKDPTPWRKMDEHREKIRRAIRVHARIARLARLILAEVED